MFRLLSLVLIVLGVAALGYGGLRFLSDDAPQSHKTAVETPLGSGASDPRPRPGVSPDGKPLTTLPELGDSAFDSNETDVEIATTAPSLLDTLQRVPVAHETPERARFGRPFDVTLAIDATGDDSATDALPGRGNIVEGEGFVGVKARATLSGASFDIEATTPNTQQVSPLTENVWRWRVTPRETGNQQLILELFAMDGDEALPVSTFRDEIIVEVSRFGQAVALAQSVSPLVMVIGGIGSLLAGLFGAARFFRGH